MIAYNQQLLSHLTLRKMVADAVADDCITEAEKQAIHEKYPVGFYTPNVFIAIGLFLLTFIVLLFSFGLLALIAREGIEKNIGSLLIFFSLASFAALEYMTRFKKHYNSGVDAGLLWGASIALFCGISLPHELNGMTNSFIICIISLFATARYADRLMAAVLHLSIAGILFYACLEFGTAGKALAPFVLMAFSLIIYFIALRTGKKQSMLHYRHCLMLVEIVSLITLYAAGNYFVVRETSNKMFNLQLQPGESIPFGWFFWISTFVIPLAYLAAGIRKKDRILIRVGLCFVAAIVFTVRYYHTIMPLEVLMTVAGVILFAFASIVTKWLQEPVNGFTSREMPAKNAQDMLNIESLIVAQTFKPGSDTGGTKFGGGSFGGGGASGEY